MKYLERTYARLEENFRKMEEIKTQFQLQFGGKHDSLPGSVTGSPVVYGGINLLQSRNNNQ